MTDLTLIEFFHVRRGAVWEGCLAEERGRAEVVWTVERDGRTDVHASSVPLGAADRLRRWTAASVRTGGAFRRWLVSDPTIPLDAEVNRIISLAWMSLRGADLVTFSVPSGDGGPELSAWPRDLRAPEAVLPTAAERVPSRAQPARNPVACGPLV